MVCSRPKVVPQPRDYPGRRDAATVWHRSLQVPKKRRSGDPSEICPAPFGCLIGPDANFSVLRAGFVVAGGYDIIPNLGNQDRDRAGGSARPHDKLPNPLDFLP